VRFRSSHEGEGFIVAAIRERHHLAAEERVLARRFDRIARAEGITMAGEPYTLSRWLRRQRS
jgi:hypothetical protein